MIQLEETKNALTINTRHWYGGTFKTAYMWLCVHYLTWHDETLIDEGGFQVRSIIFLLTDV